MLRIEDEATLISMNLDIDVVEQLAPKLWPGRIVGTTRKRVGDEQQPNAKMDPKPGHWARLDHSAAPREPASAYMS